LQNDKTPNYDQNIGRNRHAITEGTSLSEKRKHEKKWQVPVKFVRMKTTECSTGSGVHAGKNLHMLRRHLRL